jgi:hypothetical protein
MTLRPQPRGCVASGVDEGDMSHIEVRRIRECLVWNGATKSTTVHVAPEPLIYDVYVDGKWIGSRRTPISGAAQVRPS